VDERAQLTEVVLGHITRCNEALARAGLDWLRDRVSCRRSDVLTGRLPVRSR
jgi:hypothetical protein